MNGFSFNGINCSHFGVYTKSKSRPVLPQTNDNYLQVPGKPGTYLFSGELTDRMIQVECWTTSDTLELMQLKMRDIAKWLYTTDKQYLSFDDENTKSYLAKVEGVVNKKQTNKYAEFTVVFRCEPLAYGGYIETDFISDTVTISNTGTYEALPSFEVTFIAPASEIKIQLGSNFIRIIKEFILNDILEINTANGAVLLNGQRILDCLDWQNSIFFSLPTGENIINITPIGVSSAKIIYRTRWL